jgi:dTDP-4-dehydrorhamnose reductase
VSILITGANGMLGSVLARSLKGSESLLGRKHLDLTCFDSVRKFLKDKTYDVIFHCAAFTDLNYCEAEPLKSFRLHSTVVPILQKHCKKLIYISTNPTDSLKYYYISKQSGEDLTLQRAEDLVVRTNIYGLGGLFEWVVNSLKSQEVFFGYDDVIFNPVSTYQLSDFLINKSKGYSGIINICSDSKISKYNFILDVAKNLNLNFKNLKACKKQNDLDLTIPDKNAFIYPYQEGLYSLCKNLLEKRYEK